jgi:hypothetical protein
MVYATHPCDALVLSDLRLRQDERLHLRVQWIEDVCRDLLQVSKALRRKQQLHAHPRQATSLLRSKTTREKERKKVQLDEKEDEAHIDDY